MVGGLDPCHERDAELGAGAPASVDIGGFTDVFAVAPQKHLDPVAEIPQQRRELDQRGGLAA